MVRQHYEADVIVIGGGSAGVAAAIASAREGAKTILVEQQGFLGGTATAAMVIPMMPNQAGGENLTGGIYQEFLDDLAMRYGGAQRFSDNNPGWVNPELLKAYLDEMCRKAGVQLMFEMPLIDVARTGNRIEGLTTYFHGHKPTMSAAMYIDCSGNADLSSLAGVPMLDDPGRQALSLRFRMGNVNLEMHAIWLQQVDPDMKNSAVYHHPNGHWMLSTAHTLEGTADDWLLRPLFEEGMAEGLITRAEAAYFQTFSVPGMPGVVSFNCPRIVTDHPLDPLDPDDVAYAYQTGREQILRLVNFCKAKLPGFEDAFLEEIAPMLGVRESRRIRGRYILSDHDILACRKFPGETAARSSYPIDIHQASPDADPGGLKKLREGDWYEIPVDCLRPEGVDNLYVAGRCISATFVAQSSLRIQAVCWGMGETAGHLAARQVREGVAAS